MDTRVIYKVTSIIDIPLRCKCTICYSHYFYISDTKISYRQPGDTKLREYFRGYCTNCYKIIIIYDTDKLTKIEKLVWITI